jgi:DHA2 family metal-tetracycline-proton antiporter-like MFS transporter
MASLSKGAYIKAKLPAKNIIEMNSKQAIITAIILIALSLILPAFAVGNHISIFVISMIFFAGSFALMYAPLSNRNTYRYRHINN